MEGEIATFPISAGSAIGQPVSLESQELNRDALWLAQLSRRGWAWEFLRRNPEYAAAFQSRLPDPAYWGLLHFADPGLNAMQADVFWHWRNCPEVLPLAIGDKLLKTDAAFDLTGLACNIALEPATLTQRRDILFRQKGRFLQLAIFGEGELKGAQLVVSALDGPASIMARTASVRRLNDLLFNKNMRKTLYPAEGRAARLINVLTALDGWLAGLSQREIAVRMFSEARVEWQWNDPRENLRDQVRRAISAGQELMNGGYQQFLRLTFAHRIAARQGAPRA